MRLLQKMQDIQDAAELVTLENEVKEKNKRIKELREYFKAQRLAHENYFLAGPVLFTFQERELEKFDKKALKLANPELYQEYTAQDIAVAMLVKKAA